MKLDAQTRDALGELLSVEPLLDSMLRLQLTSTPMQRVIGTRKLSRIAFFGLVQESARHAMLAEQYAKRMKLIHRKWGK